MFDLTEYLIEYLIEDAAQGDAVAQTLLLRTLKNDHSGRAKIRADLRDRCLDAVCHGSPIKRGRQKSNPVVEYQIARFAYDLIGKGISLEKICEAYNASKLAKDMEQHVSYGTFRRFYYKHLSVVQFLKEYQESEQQYH